MFAASSKRALDDGAVARRAVERLLDRHDVRVECRLLEEADDHVEGLVGVVEQHVLLADRREHVAFVVLHAFGHAGSEGGPEEVGAFVEDEFLEVGGADQPVDLDHLVLGDAEFLHDQRAELRGGPRGDLHPHHFAPAAALQRHLEFSHEVLGLLLDLEIAVAQHPEGAVADHPVAGEEAFEMEEQEFLERKEAVLPGGRLEPDEARDLLRDWQKRLQVALVRLALELEREAEARVRDEREGMRGVDGERRQDREDLAQEDVVELLAVIIGQLVAGEQGDAGGLHVCLELPPGHELLRHEAAGVVVDEDELFGRRQPVDRRRGVAGMGELAQARHADGVEFVEVRGADRHEAHPFEERNTGVRGLLEHAPVEGEPREFTVEEAPRPLALRIGNLDGGGKRGGEKIRGRHEGLMARDCVGNATIMPRRSRACPEAVRQGHG